ncbi:hypothetical protein J4G08_12615 [Candidatus Poribacteria bacterium]|nr:hypothetical protein [Candidatus Poribacteria bacterium]
MGSLLHIHSYKRGLIFVVTGCILSGLLFGTLSFTRATLQETSDCTESPRPDCLITEKQPIPCPKQKSKPHCSLEAVK